MLNYKKPALRIIIGAVIVCIAVAIVFLTNPKTSIDDSLKVFIDHQIAEHHQYKLSEGPACVFDREIIGADKSSDETTVYMWVLYEEYSMENGTLKIESGVHLPTVITVRQDDSHGQYKLVEYWIPRDGSYYSIDIKDKFP